MELLVKEIITKIRLVTRMINNGIISFEDGNSNSVYQGTIDYDLALNEIYQLQQKIEEDLSLLVTACQEKNESKFIKELRKLKKGTINLIKHLGLKTLETLIEKYVSLY